jgi:hypothetical protein
LQFKSCVEKWAASSPNAIAAEYFPLAEEDTAGIGTPNVNYSPLKIAARLHTQALSLRDNGALWSVHLQCACLTQSWPRLRAHAGADDAQECHWARALRLWLSST